MDDEPPLETVEDLTETLQELVQSGLVQEWPDTQRGTVYRAVPSDEAI